MRSNRALLLLACVFVNAACLDSAFAHGFAGKRFFPATLATEDPFVADELSLPTISRRKTQSGEDPATVETSVAIDFSRRVTSNLGIGFGAAYLRQSPEGAPTQNGWDNVAANAKYQFYQDDAHETILSVGADWDIGGTGAKRIGAESFSTVTPAVFFGRGLGDLPESMKYLRPLAITGSAGLAIPTRASTTTVDDSGTASIERHPHVFKLGLAVQYSVPYLQSFVKDMGWREPFSKMIPVVEFALEKPVNRGGGGMTGTVNPGLLFAGRHMQLGVEAVIPVNHRTGGKTGIMMQLHFFLDDMFPKAFGKPLFGK